MSGLNPCLTVSRYEPFAYANTRANENFRLYLKEPPRELTRPWKSRFILDCMPAGSNCWLGVDGAVRAGGRAALQWEAAQSPRPTFVDVATPSSALLMLADDGSTWLSGFFFDHLMKTPRRLELPPVQAIGDGNSTVLLLETGWIVVADWQIRAYATPDAVGPAPTLPEQWPPASDESERDRKARIDRFRAGQRHTRN